MKIFRNRHIPFFLVIVTMLSADLSHAADGKSLFDSAYKTMQSGNMAVALDLYGKAIAAEPASQDIWLEYTSCLRKTKRMQEAAMAGWRCLELGQETPGAWANLGNVFLECNAWTQAFEAYINAGKLCPDDKWNIQNFLNLGYTCLQWGEISTAARAIACALSIDPQSRLALVDYALLLGNTGRTDTAKEELNKALALPAKPGDMEDSNTITFGKMIMETLQKEGRIVFPKPASVSFQVLPVRFLTRPAKGTALKLPIDEEVTRMCTLPDGYFMSMRTPATWIESFEVKRESFFTIRLDVPGKLPSTLLVSPLPPSKKGYTVKNTEQDVQKMGQILMKHASDPELVVYPLAKEEKRFGSAFTVTDKNWKKGRPGDYPHVTQGIMVNGEHACTFTLLSHSRETDYIERNLDIVRNIQFKKTVN